ncbi:SDR family oxidoreductase [Microbacterium sp. M28]|uniref:NAD(P)-dependent oxidoreductase n=1 Tax=Microbacterium sp. M28 TaxID=2962064 RepID=UPI0021F46532|nr:NAD(P)-binding oxidoreductase [Microbacterium sp. M28]UYO96292.1 SDR family oxidoreductase [Microbacterium sp. M28]
MHIVVIGANGRTGRHVVRQARHDGHRVTAVVRDPGAAELTAGVEIIRADVVGGADFEFPAGADVVISTLGKNSPRDRTPVCTVGTERVMAAMRRAGIGRLVATSASPVLRRANGEPFWFRATVRPIVRWSGRHIYADLEDMEHSLRQSDGVVAWTIVRPGYLVDQPGGAYELVEESNAMGVVHRADLARALLDVAGRPHAAGISYGIASRPEARS